MEHILGSLFSRQGSEQIEVLMKTTLQRARQVTSTDMGTLEETEEAVIFRRAAFHLQWVAFFLMCLDFPVIDRKPDSLREILQAMATDALQMTTDVD